MVVVKILCYAGLSAWLVYEIVQLIKAIKDKRKRDKAKKLDVKSDENLNSK